MHKEIVNVVSAGTSRPVVIPDAYLSDYFALLASLSQIKVLNTYKARQVADCSPATNIQSLSSTSGPAAAPTVNPECICTDDYNPVCAGGQTYPNACTAICYGAFLGYWGPCKDPQPADPCVCPLVYLPVCGDGKMYANFCEARCDWAQSITPGECGKPS
ncbi:hypothetical protein E4U12_000399 [Claviceps purpurea]|nr:hypothetical protein E4U12_000399 [Claviceps purpurea]